MAHEVDVGGDFIVGLLHPVLGLDHLLAMLSVGIISSQIGGKAIWTIPIAFVVMMFVGGLLGLAEIQLNFVELAIALSVLFLGIIILSGRDIKIPITLTMLSVAFFAIFHGYAHCAEMPYMVKAAFYSTGFILGTAAIHIAGIVVTVLINKIQFKQYIFHFLGASFSIVGLLFLFKSI